MTTDGMIQLAIAIPPACLFLAACFRGAVKVGQIYKEVTPNGGKSLKDRVMSLERTQLEQTQSLKRIENMLANRNRCNHCESTDDNEP